MSSQFPAPIHLPTKVYTARLQRQKEVVRSAKWGIFLRLIIIAFELTGVIWINSIALLMDALASFVDVFSSFFLIFCMKLAQRPPDDDHPFGHGRYEPLGGFILGVLLIVTGGLMLVQQEFLHKPSHQTIAPFGWVFPFIAVILLEIIYRFMIYTAKKEHSPALAVDAYHYRIDGITSLLATFALLVAWIWPAWSELADHIGAILIALFMIGLGIYASRANFHQLMDKVPEERFFKKVKEAAERVEGVKGTEKIRIQTYGPDAHVDIDIEVEPQLTVDIAHRISQKVRAEIQQTWPAVQDVTVHIEPFYENDH
jgi:cation diffusion facilitator family transporter